MSAQTTVTRQVHVLHLIESLGAGGAERLLYTNLKNIDSSLFRSSVVTIFSEPNHWVEPIRKLGVTVESLDCDGLRDLAAGIARLRRWLSRNQPDLIHTHLWAANIIGRTAGRLSGIPVISSIHNPDHENEAWSDGSEVSLTKRRAVRSLDRWTSRFACQRMIAVSQYVKQSAHRHLRFPLDRIELLYNPIDIDAFGSCAEKDRAEIFRELDLPDDALLLLNIGRVSPQKGLLYAIQALPRVLEKFPSAFLVSAGPTDDRKWLAHLESEAKTLGVADRVRILGPRRDVPQLLMSCDLFIFPSLYEGLGIALIEAMAAGCACVATRTGPIPEIIEHGRNGLLVNPADPISLGDAICGLLSKPHERAAMGRAAQQTALEKFQPKTAAERLATIYQSTLEEYQRG